MKRPAGTMLLAAVMGFALGACRDTAASSDADAVVGTYMLLTIDGVALPVVVDQQGEDIAEVIQGTVSLDSDRTFDDATVLRLTIAGVVSTETEAAAGGWTLSGRIVGFAPNDASAPYAMTWDGADQLTQAFNGFTLVYRR